MENYIIFKSPMVWVLLSAIAAIYVADTVLNRFIFSYQKKVDYFVNAAQTEQVRYKLDCYNAAREFQKISSLSFSLNIMRFCTMLITVANLALHVWEMIYLLTIKAKPEEVLFLLMISIALALTSNGIKKEV